MLFSFKNYAYNGNILLFGPSVFWTVHLQSKQKNKTRRMGEWGGGGWGGWEKGRSGVEFVGLFYTAERIKSPSLAFTFHPFAVSALPLFSFLILRWKTNPNLMTLVLQNPPCNVPPLTETKPSQPKIKSLTIKTKRTMETPQDKQVTKRMTMM